MIARGTGPGASLAKRVVISSIVAPPMPRLRASQGAMSRSSDFQLCIEELPMNHSMQPGRVPRVSGSGERAIRSASRTAPT
jgi:transposase InsO family protein